jgi:hypothetical protein
MRLLFIILLFPFLGFSQSRITVNAGTAGGSGVSTDTVSLSNRIDHSNISVNRSIQRLNHTPFMTNYGKYNGWFGSYDYGNTHAVIVREGTEHLYNGSDPVYMVRYTTADKGNSWV